jgi:hypothetical protein
MKILKDPAWINAIGTVILIGFTLILILQGPAIGWLHGPWFVLPLTIVGGLIVVAILNFRTAKLQASGIKIDALRIPPPTSCWCNAMADADTKNIFSRVTAVRWRPRRVFDGNNNYIEFEVTFVNASVFELTSPQLLGVAEFDGHPLPHPPRIVEPFALVRGAKIWMKIHQPLSLEIARDLQQRVNLEGTKANLDFSKVRVIFDVEFPGRKSWKWNWTGRDVSIKEITTFD